MHLPVLVTPPQHLPVTVQDVMLALRIDEDMEAEVESQIRAAVQHYEGWKGVLGICLVSQTWREDFESFDRSMPLALRPVQSVTSVKWRNAAGDEATVPGGSYVLSTDAAGRSRIQFLTSFALPTDLREVAPVSIEYVAGWPMVGDPPMPTTPEDIRAAIKIRVQTHIDEAANAAADILGRVEIDLVSKYRSPIL